MLKRLFVIGNGFDIAHGLNTDYKAFLEQLSSEHSSFYNAVCQYISEDVLWSNFEEALGYLDYEQLQDDNSCYYLDYGDDNWRDSANHDYQYMIGEYLSFASNIPRFFLEWINQIDTDVSPIVSPSILNRNCLFLNFNYTDTLEQVYDIPTTQILYIHGKASRGDNIIVGHHDAALFQEKATPAFNSAEEHEMYMDSLDEDFRLQEAREIIRGYFRKTYKDTASIIQQNKNFFNALQPTDEIYILGHSLSPIDFDYFIEIARSVLPSCKWYISYYSQEDFCQAQNFVNKLRLQNCQLITFRDIK